VKRKEPGMGRWGGMGRDRQNFISGVKIYIDNRSNGGRSRVERCVVYVALNEENISGREKKRRENGERD
jgi:hypothetical protein